MNTYSRTIEKVYNEHYKSKTLFDGLHLFCFNQGPNVIILGSIN